jgi:hypothetical protein
MRAGNVCGATNIVELSSETGLTDEFRAGDGFHFSCLRDKVVAMHFPMGTPTFLERKY